MIDVLVEDGPECVVYDQGTTNIDNGLGSMMEMHFFGRRHRRGQHRLLGRGG